MPPTPPPRSHYVLEYGSYYLRSPHSSNIHLMSDQIAIAFVVGDGYLLKHGSPESVLQWWKANRGDALPLFGELAVATLPARFPVELINQALDFKNVRCILEHITILERTLPGPT